MDWNKHFAHIFNPKEFNIGKEHEARWIIENLPGEGKILDVGCLESGLNKMLVDYYDEVWGIDIRSIDINNPKQIINYNFKREDIEFNTFIDSYFDDIIFMSSLEHIGLIAYGNNKEDLDKDRRSLIESSRILKSKGAVYITVPFSDKGEGRYDPKTNKLWEKRYSLEDIEKRVVDLSIFEIEKLQVVNKRRHAYILLRRRS